jgi:hypothetical protein
MASSVDPEGVPMTNPPRPAVPSFPDTRLGVIRGITYGMYGKPDEFLPQTRALGARTVRVYLYWSQVEPEPGYFVWDIVDAFIDQLDDRDEAWVTVCSSSTWATRRPTRVLPPSPAHDVDQYARFVTELVRHCRGRVRFWQCDNEPCLPLLWAGTAREYLTQLEAFWHAVKQVDPGGLVVLGGAPTNAIPNGGPAHDTQAIEFFDELLREGGEHFDVFDVHLYGDAYAIPDLIQACRQRMGAHGYHKPIVAGEYNGPLPLQFPQLMPHLSELLPTLREQITGQSTEQQANGTDEEPLGPDEPVMLALYARRATLPPELQMFLADCPPELEDKRHRLNCRDLVVRNMLAVSAGVRRTLCWQLAPEMPGHISPYHVMRLLFGKFVLMDYEDETIRHRYPAADTLTLLTRKLDGVQEIRRLTVADQSGLYLFEVRRERRGPMLVVWERRDDFTGEDAPPTPFTWPWTPARADAIDALGSTVAIQVRDGHIQLPISNTPVFVEDQQPPHRANA